MLTQKIATQYFFRPFGDIKSFKGQNVHLSVCEQHLKYQLLKAIEK